jgi:hypothetical protein
MEPHVAPPSRRYLVELPVGAGYEDVAALAARARSDASARGARGSARFLRAIAVPDDSLCLLLYEAGSRVAVAAAVRRLGIRASTISASLVADADGAGDREGEGSAGEGSARRSGARPVSGRC